MTPGALFFCESQPMPLLLSCVCSSRYPPPAANGCKVMSECSWPGPARRDPDCSSSPSSSSSSSAQPLPASLRSAARRLLQRGAARGYSKEGIPMNCSPFPEYLAVCSPFMPRPAPPRAVAVDGGREAFAPWFRPHSVHDFKPETSRAVTGGAARRACWAGLSGLAALAHWLNWLAQ